MTDHPTVTIIRRSHATRSDVVGIELKEMGSAARSCVSGKLSNTVLRTSGIVRY